MADDSTSWLSTIANGAKKIAWSVVPLSGSALFGQWLVNDWAPARGKQVLDSLKAAVGLENLDFATIGGVDWSRINQFVPCSEMVQYLIKYLLIWAGIFIIKWVGKLLSAGAVAAV